MADLAAIHDRIRQSYTHEIELLAGDARRDIGQLVPDAGNLDAYNHERMIRFIVSLIEKFGSGEWLTVGDNGDDAVMLRSAGVRQVTASSISTVFLQRLAEAGCLDRIPVRELNAEKLDLPDGAVDVLVCKEAYHHFPRAPLAFYEFLRVSRRGVVLIEPLEGRGRPLDLLRAFAKMVLRRRSPAYEKFEPVGNFIYRVDVGEIRRMLTALQVPWFAIQPFNNFMTRRLIGASRRDPWAMLLMKFGIAVQDLFSTLRLMSPGMAAIFVPTGAADEHTRDMLEAEGFTIVETPRNPYRPDDVLKDFYAG